MFSVLPKKVLGVGSVARKLLVLVFLSLPFAVVASGAPITYAVTGDFNLIAGATGNVVGYPTDPRLLSSMTPVGEYTANVSGELTLDPVTGVLTGLSLAIDDASFTLDATWHIDGLAAPPHGTISTSNRSHGATGGETGTVTPGEIDFFSGVDFDTVSGLAGCSSPYGALFCQNASIGPFYDVGTGVIYALGQSNPFVIDVAPGGSLSVTIVFDTGIVTGDAQAVQTLTLTAVPEPTSAAMLLTGILGLHMLGVRRSSTGK